MAKKKHMLSATMSDGYVKTIGPTSVSFTHYWRIVAVLQNGKTDVFWGHCKSLSETNKKRDAAEEASKQRGWSSYEFEIAVVEKA